MRRRRSSISAIVGTGLGGGVIESGEVVGARPAWPASWATCTSRWTACSSPGQPIPRCNCGFIGDLESVASLSGIENNLLPFWLTRYPDHPLAEPRIIEHGGQERARLRRERRRDGAADLRAAGDGDRADVHDRRQLHRPRRLLRRRRRDRGGTAVPGLVPRQRCASTRCCARNRRSPELRARSDLDMAGARGSAMAALQAIRP